MADLEDTTKRTIEEVYDLQEGVFINAKEFFGRSEAEIIRFRGYLEEAIQLNQPRFVCSHCGQMVKISGKITEKGRVSFFSHLHDSDDCDIKTTTQLSKEEIEARKYGMVGESDRHKRLKKFIGDYLERDKDSGITDVCVSKRINSDIPYLNWRCPDVSVTYNGRRLVFELQLSTTFLSVIVDRDIFYRLNNYYVVWVFNFDNEENKLTLENLLAKDIYYANKRNVFILDSDAMDKSEKEGKLYLSVTWLDENDKFVEKKFVSIEELSFDENSSKPYYFDADALYYQNHPEEKQRVESLERDRQHVLDALMKKKKEEEEKSRRIEEAISKKREQMRALGSVATLYFKNKKWGYEFDGTKLTLPIYASASEIDATGYGYVTRNRRMGVVNQYGEEVVPCQYKKIIAMPNHRFVVDDKDGNWVVYKGDKICKIKKEDEISVKKLNENFVSITINRKQKKVIALVSGNGKCMLVESVGKFKDGIAKVAVLKKVKGEWGEYEVKKIKFLLTSNGYLFLENADLSKDVIPAILFREAVGLLDKQYRPISPFDYSSVNVSEDDMFVVKKKGGYGLLEKNVESGIYEETIHCTYDDLEVKEVAVKVKKNGKYGALKRNDETGVYEEYVPCEYDGLDFFGEKVKVRKDMKYGVLRKKTESGLCEELIPSCYDSLEITSFNLSKVRVGYNWGVIDDNNNIVVPIRYDSIGDITRDLIHVKKGGRLGACDYTGKEIVEDKCPFTENLVRGKSFEKYGLTDKDGNVFLDYKYDSITLFDNIFIKADGDLFKIDGTQICSDVSSVSNLGEGLVIVESQSLYGVIDKNGTLVQQFQYSKITETEDGYLVTERVENNKIHHQYKNYYVQNKYFGLLDSNGRTLLECNNRKVSIENGYIYVEKDGFFKLKVGKIEKLCEDNRKESSQLGDSGKDFNLVSRSRDGSWGLGVVTSEWEQVVPCRYDEIKMMSENWFALRKGGRWGCTSVDLSQSYPCEYPNICLNEDKFPSVQLSGKIIRCDEFKVRKYLKVNNVYAAVIEEIREYGLMVRVEGNKCLLHISEIRKQGRKISDYKEDDHIHVKVKSYDKEKKRYSLGLLNDDVIIVNQVSDDSLFDE